MQTEKLTRPGAGQPMDRYTAVAIALHWLIAALLLTNVWFGLQMEEQRGMAKFATMQLHKSIGLTVLILTLARIAWRLTHRPPPYAPPIRRWEHAVSKVVHFSFYLLLLGLPLTGWAIVSLSPTNIPTLLYDTVPWPHLGFLHDLPVSQRRGLEDTASETHETLVTIAYVLIALHVAGALKHAVVDRDGVAHRMIPLPFLRSKAS
jgi:cytochrome b561